MDRTENPDDALIATQEVVVNKALDEIGKALREQGLTLEDLIEQGRKIRGQLLQDLYGINDADSREGYPR